MQLKDYKVGNSIEITLLLSDPAIRVTGASKQYLTCTLSDISASMSANCWEISESHSEFKAGDVVDIKGQITEYKSKSQIKIDSIVLSEVTSMEGLIPISRYNIETMFMEVERLIASVANTKLRTILERMVLGDELRVRYKQHQAGKFVHHAYLGGLLEHKLFVTKLALNISSTYGNIDNDILISTGLLHDIGKIYEIKQMPINDYTTEGKLLGHISIALTLIDREAVKLGIEDTEEIILLKHGILSHHGKFEYGSPVIPKTREALILHYADMIDSRLNPADKALGNCNSDGWSDKVYSWDTDIYKTK